LLWYAVEIPGGDVSFSFDFEWTAECCFEVVSDEVIGGFGDLNSVWFPVRFHSTGGVDGVAPLG